MTVFVNSVINLPISQKLGISGELSNHPLSDETHVPRSQWSRYSPSYITAKQMHILVLPSSEAEYTYKEQTKLDFYMCMCT
jgi:hypothetical protein